MLKVQIYKCICESWGFPWIYCRSVFLNYKILYYMFSVELIIFLGLVYVDLRIAGLLHVVLFVGFV